MMRLRLLALLLPCVLLSGCTLIPVKIETQKPDGTVCRASGVYLNILQNKSLKLGDLEYNINNDPAVQLIDKAYELGAKGAKGAAK